MRIRSCSMIREARHRADTECLTERRRRKLQHLSLNVEDPCADGHSESVA